LIKLAELLLAVADLYEGDAIETGVDKLLNTLSNPLCSGTQGSSERCPCL
jgi:hypothetical protein